MNNNNTNNANTIINNTIILLDNFDSFTYNLANELKNNGLSLKIFRNNLSAKVIFNEIENIKGEIVVVVEGNHELENFDDIDVIEHVNMFIDDGLSQMEAIKKVAKLRNVPKSEIYNKFHR